MGLVLLITILISVGLGGLFVARSRNKPLAKVAAATSELVAQVQTDSFDLRFDLVEPQVGWVATSNYLFWTESDGQSWRDITPLGLTLPIVQVDFANNKMGWLVAFDPESTPLNLEVHLTRDGGKSWQVISTGLMSSFPVLEESFSGIAHSQLMESGEGWLVLKLTSGVNFSLGELFVTTDWGETWTHRSTMSGEPFHFFDRLTGYQLAPHGTGLLRTEDGALTWQDVEMPSDTAETDMQRLPGLPSEINEDHWVLPVYSYQNEQLASTTVWESFDRGNSWNVAVANLEPSQQVFRGEPLLQTLSDLGVLTQWETVTFAPDQNLIEKNTSLPFGIDQLTLTNLESKDGQNAWARFSGGGCTTDKETSKVVCSQAQMMAFTTDGGNIWALLPLPSLVPSLIVTNPEDQTFAEGSLTTNQESSEAVTASPNWQRIIAKGFDSCAPVNMSRMATWRASSPYSVYGLYIGGSMAFCPNTVFNATSLRQLFSNGWRFIPTWVGPQAPCTDFKYRFSLDPTTAYAEGVENANQAIEALKSRGLTNPDGSGSIVYYDLERFVNDAACKAAARSFLKGWTTRLHQTGNLSGLYATSRNLDHNQIYTIDPAPDAVWIAEWFWEPYYRDWVTVFHVDYLSSTYWADHQRIYQYTGGHSETWGGLSLPIDSNVIDGVVAVPYSSDITLPVSQITLSGTKGTNGWYKGPVTITLSAMDNVSGIQGIYYNLNNTEWKKYTAPFIVSADQVHVLQYRAVDGVYNWEDPQGTTIKIDSTPPTYPSGLNWLCPYAGLPQALCNDESFSWTSATDALSGINTTYYYWGADPNGSGTQVAGTQFDPPPIEDQFTYYLRFSTRDQAGNQSAWRTIYTLRYNARFGEFHFLPLVQR